MGIMTDTAQPAPHATPADAPNAVGTTGFFGDGDFDFITRCVIGYAAQGVFDVGQVFATIARIEDGNADSWYTAWRATAVKLHAQAIASLAAGNTETAARQFLGASEGYAQAVGFSDRMRDQTAFAPNFALHQDCWEAFIDASDGRVERVAVPYEGTTLPGYLFRPDNSGAKRPTVVLTNGSDGSISGLWASGATTALARGYNAFLYDGPGQQSSLFQHELHFRFDWEAVLTPVVDSIIDRPDVDGSALFAYGISQAGYWVTRALAFEHRFVAAVVDPGVVDVATSWLSHLPAELIAILHAGSKDVFNGAMDEVGADPAMAQEMTFRGRPYGKTNAYDTFASVLEYNVRDVVGKITTPLLIADPDDETFWPGQADELDKLLTSEHELIHFSREDGANFHCEPMGRAEAEFAMFDFYARHLAAAQGN
jgi:hypothetical protein